MDLLVFTMKISPYSYSEYRERNETNLLSLWQGKWFSLNFTARKAKNTSIWKDELKKNKEKKVHASAIWNFAFYLEISDLIF